MGMYPQVGEVLAVWDELGTGLYYLGQKTVYYPHVSWFSTFSTSSFFRPRVIPKVLILGQSHTSVSQTVNSPVK